MVLAVLAAVAVVIGVIAVVAVRTGSSPSSPTGSGGSESIASRAVMDAVGKVDPAVLATVGSGGLPNSFAALPADAGALTGQDGKPQILYVGADYCPYCAAQRWGMAVALSRFGSFDHLDLGRSSSSDVFPDTATFSFRNAAYSSAYVDLVAVETADRNGAPLQSPSAAQQALLARYDAPPYVPAAAAGGIPWLDVANRYVMVSAGFTPGLLSGLSWEQVAAKLGDARDPVAMAILGDANNITAAICKATGMQPGDVCTSAPIRPIVAAMP